jgi:hypothetical protein
MIKPGVFSVIVIGSRYVRMVDPLVVGQNLEQAKQFTSFADTQSALDKIKERKLKKPVKVLRVEVQEIQNQIDLMYCDAVRRG